MYQAGGVPGVESVSPVYARIAVWKNPLDHSSRNVFVPGLASAVLDAPGVNEQLHLVHRRDALLFDAGSRPEHGPIADMVRAGTRVSTEVNDRQIEVAGLFEVGTSFGIDGSVLTSDDNFLRLFPDRPRNQIDFGW